MHICVSKQTIIGSNNGLSPGWRQAIIWTNAGILFIGTLGANFSEIFSKIHTFSFKKMHLKMSAKWLQFRLSLDVLRSQSELTKDTPYLTLTGELWVSMMGTLDQSVCVMPGGSYQYKDVPLPVQRFPWSHLIMGIPIPRKTVYIKMGFSTPLHQNHRMYIQINTKVRFSKETLHENG